MYVLLTGKHPLYDINDSLEAYSKKLEKPNFKFNDVFSEYFFNTSKLRLKIVSQKISSYDYAA